MSVYVIGHKNPDTDSIVSAIAYASLKNQLGGDLYEPIRLGKLNKETAFILSELKIESPRLLDHIRTRVKDVMTKDLITVGPNSSVKEAGELIYNKNIRSVPVVDEDGRLLGAVTERSIAHRYIEELQVRSIKETGLSLGKIAETLEGEIIVGQSDGAVLGNVLIGAMQPETMATFIEAGDVVILGDRANAQLLAIKKEISCLIVTGGYRPEDEVISAAEKAGVFLILTPKDSFATARLINLSRPVEGLMDRNYFTLQMDELIVDITEDLLASENRQGFVTDEDNHLFGMVTRSDLINPPRRSVILVDHSEKSQSVDGIEGASIVEIIDHHRLGDIQTAEPILVISEPVGSTSTIVYEEYKKHGIKPDKRMAALMLAAILSDTVLLKSPTATSKDEAAIAELGKLAGLDPMEFGVRMYLEASGVADMSAAQTLMTDFKVFNLSDLKVGIGQVETTDLDLVLARKSDLIKEMERALEDKGLDTVLLMVTDIVKVGTELLAVGKERLVEKRFSVELKDNSAFLPGVISRKKQVAPVLAKGK
ncbi:MAG: putative manganese-dependent inorganic diphosphatase [Actinomycetota bacterium]|nr:putative manganese-dependent inorganic diphosphatase [Actinomycetota bacterium]